MLDRTRLALYMHMKYGGTKPPIIQTTSLLIAAPWLWHSIGICTFNHPKTDWDLIAGYKFVYALEVKLDVLVVGIEVNSYSCKHYYASCTGASRNMVVPILPCR